MAEVKHRKLDDSFGRAGLRYADTLYDARRVSSKYFCNIRYTDLVACEGQQSNIRNLVSSREEEIRPGESV